MVKSLPWDLFAEVFKEDDVKASDLCAASGNDDTITARTSST